MPTYDLNTKWGERNQQSQYCSIDSLNLGDDVAMLSAPSSPCEALEIGPSSLATSQITHRAKDWATVSVTFQSTYTICPTKFDKIKLNDDRMEWLKTVWTSTNNPVLHDSITIALSNTPSAQYQAMNCLISEDGLQLVPLQSSSLELVFSGEAKATYNRHIFVLLFYMTGDQNSVLANEELGWLTDRPTCSWEDCTTRTPACSDEIDN